MSAPARLAVDVSSTLRRDLVSLKRARKVAMLALESERVGNALVSIAFVSSPRMKAINLQYLGRNRPTDVIAFGFVSDSSAGAVVGDIYICPDVARTNAADENVSLREEIDRLVVHGILHVLGHDHPESKDRVRSSMWKKQEALLRKIA